MTARLFNDLESCATRDSEGKVSFSGFGFDEARVVLEDLLELNPEISSDQKPGFVYGALFSAAASGQLSADAFIGEIRRRENEYLSRPLRRFILVSQVSIHSSDELPGMRIGGTSISFPSVLSARFAEARESLADGAAHSLHGDFPRDYRWVRVSAHAKSPGGAADLSLDALQLFCGLMNLATNRSKGMRTSWGGTRQPVNEVTLGPFHTVHHPSGALAAESWWYEPDYIAALKPKRYRSELKHVLAYVRRARSLLQSVPYFSEVEDWIRSYSRSLDERDWSTSFVRLWQTLEAATMTGTKPYTITVNRTASIHRDSEYHRAVLDRLRRLRNTLVHSGSEGDQLESKLYLLKRYVESMLEFHLRFAGTFERLDDVADFLDLPIENAELIRRYRLVNRACRFREVDASMLSGED